MPLASSLGPPLRQLWDHRSLLPDQSADLGKAAMVFREVGVHEIREVLRLWLRGEGLRSAERLPGLDRKTVRRYVAAARSGGVQGDGGEGRLGDELLT